MTTLELNPRITTIIVLRNDTPVEVVVLHQYRVNDELYYAVQPVGDYALGHSQDDTAFRVEAALLEGWVE